MKHLLTAEQLSIHQSTRLLIKKLSFTLHSGEIWGILGPNGSGKTSLIQTLAGLHPATKGRIYLGARALNTLKRATIAKDLGILFQDYEDIFALSVYEYCSGGRYPHAKNHTKDHSIIQEALKLMDLHDKMAQNIQTLSGGERQRLSIATLLTQSPSLYLFDEPTNHLDLYYQIKILEHIQYLAKTKEVGVLMTLHDINLAKAYCHQVILLFRDGEHLMGSPDVLFTKTHLTRLYQHPVRKFGDDAAFVWFPDLIN